MMREFNHIRDMSLYAWNTIHSIVYQVCW